MALRRLGQAAAAGGFFQAGGQRGGLAAQQAGDYTYQSLIINA
jgi:hypothetical protein